GGRAVLVDAWKDVHRVERVRGGDEVLRAERARGDGEPAGRRSGWVAREAARPGCARAGSSRGGPGWEVRVRGRSGRNAARAVGAPEGGVGPAVVARQAEENSGCSMAGWGAAANGAAVMIGRSGYLLAVRRARYSLRRVSVGPV